MRADRLTPQARCLAALLGSVPLAGPVEAEQDSASRIRNCQQLTRAVAVWGIVNLRLDGGTAVRVVRDRSFCQPGERIARTIVRTNDIPECVIGFRCTDRAESDE